MALAGIQRGRIVPTSSLNLKEDSKKKLWVSRFELTGTSRISGYNRGVTEPLLTLAAGMSHSAPWGSTPASGVSSRACPRR